MDYLIKARIGIAHCEPLVKPEHETAQRAEWPGKKHQQRPLRIADMQYLLVEHTYRKTDDEPERYADQRKGDGEEDGERCGSDTFAQCQVRRHLERPNVKSSEAFRTILALGL